MADVQLVLSKVKMYLNHPIPNQLFADIFPLFRDPIATEACISHLVAHIRATHDLTTLAAIVCLESRGFFLGPLLASRLALACIPIRKRGKLPGATVSVSYEKEYGPDAFELKTDAFEGVRPGKVVLVDDLLGKGGSVAAARELVEMLGREVAEAVVVFDIPALYGGVREKLGELKWYGMVQLTEENLPPAV